MAGKESMPRRAFLARAAGASASVTGGGPGPAEPGGARAAPAGPATDLDELGKAVEGVIGGKRIGRPVFVRYTLHGPVRPGQVVAQLARMAQAVRGWVGQPLGRLYAVGSARGGQVTLTLEFREGATALVSVARGRTRGDGVDLMVVGNHGAVYYDAARGPLADGAAEYRAARADPALLALIGRALRSGRPETLSAGGQP